MKNIILIICLLIVCLSILPGRLMADDLTAQDIMEAVNNRAEGLEISRTTTIQLTDRRGITRTEQTTGYRKYFGDEKRTVIFYTEPSNVRGTGFLTYDYPDKAVDDDQWLYLPALRKVRRISASDRGDYFLGTDLTYEEIKKENKIEIEDYTFRLLGNETIDGRVLAKVEAIPVSDALMKELGYSRVIFFIDRDIWVSRKSDYWDVNGNHLKTISNQNIAQIDNIWTVTEVSVENHKTQHKTHVLFENIDYQSPVNDSLFTQQSLRRGLR